MGFNLFIGIRISGVGEYRGVQYGDYEGPRRSIRIESDYLVIEVETPEVNKENIIVKLIGNDELLVNGNGLLTAKLAIKGTRIGVER